MDKLHKHILRRLYSYGYVGRRHTAREEMKQGLPSHMKNMKLINEACDKLIKEGYLEHCHGDRISINRIKRREIAEIVRAWQNEANTT
ncbi:MAG: hypothetical protein J4473_04995 [Candidatus Aenigmarchaeota archaeon]|nr:hypothetical protein [Candidatus Aenigmarchaeota archaeon]